VNILAASDSPQLYVPADQPDYYEWLTVPRLLLMLVLLALCIAATFIGAAHAIRVERRRVDKLKASNAEFTTRLATLTAKVDKLRKDADAMEQDVAALFNAAHEHPAEDEQPPTEPAQVVSSPLPFPYPIVEPRKVGRHAAPEEP